MVDEASATELVEHEKSAPIALRVEERDSLLQLVPRLSTIPVPGEQDLYILNPGSNVGAVQLGGRRFVLRPKIGIKRLLFLLSYSMDPSRWQRLGFDFAEDEDLFEALVPGFAFQLEEALLQGRFHGYRPEEASLPTVRGRIRVADQLRNRFGLVPPIECSYDEFTDDVLLNRLLKAAIARLGQVRIRSPHSRARLAALAGSLANVSTIPFDPHNVPEVRFDRLNMHFRGPVEFARLVLQSRSVDARPGNVGGASFVIDLAKVFEDFVVIALREALSLSSRSFPQQTHGRRLHLDVDEAIRLKPDISWWREDNCVFVGDVKYKRTEGTAAAPNPDIYQLLAYTTATGLDRGLLIYAAGEDSERVLEIPVAGKKIEIMALDLDLKPNQILDQIDKIADVVRSGVMATAAG